MGTSPFKTAGVTWRALLHKTPFCLLPAPVDGGSAASDSGVWTGRRGDDSGTSPGQGLGDDRAADPDAGFGTAYRATACANPGAGRNTTNADADQNALSHSYADSDALARRQHGDGTG